MKNNIKKNLYRNIDFIASIFFGILFPVLSYIKDQQAFLQNDAVSQFYPMFKSIGYTILKSGYWPDITLQSMQGGGILIGYQYGLLNPFILLITLIISKIHHPYIAALIFATFHYVILLVGFSTLCRVLKANRFLVAATLPALATNTLIAHIYAAAWWPGLVGIAWFPFALAGILACGESRYKMVLASVAIALTLTAGWPHTTIATAFFVIVACGFWILNGKFKQALSCVFSSVSGAALAAPAIFALASIGHLAGRANELSNHDFWVFNLTDILNCSSAALSAKADNFVGKFQISEHFTYLNIFLIPFLGLISFKNIQKNKYNYIIITIIFSIAILILTQGPDQAGPLRYPFRWIPIFHVSILAAWVALLSNPYEAPLSKNRIIWIFGTPVLIAILTIIRDPQHARASVIFLFVTAFATVVYLYTRQKNIKYAVIATTLIIVSMSVHGSSYFRNASFGGLPSEILNTPSDLSVIPKSYRMLWDTYGAKATIHADAENALGNINLLYGRSTIGGYDSIQYKNFVRSACLSIFGNFDPNCQYGTIEDALKKWNSIDPTYGKSLLQLLKITAIDSQSPNSIPSVQKAISQNWTQKPGKYFQTFEPKETLQELPGSISFLSKGVKIIKTEVEKIHKERLILETPTVDSKIVFARVLWPGYTLTFNGKPLEIIPYNGFLISANLPSNTNGVLELKYHSPHFALSIFFACLSIVSNVLVILYGKKLLNIIWRDRKTVG